MSLFGVESIGDCSNNELRRYIKQITFEEALFGCDSDGVEMTIFFEKDFKFEGAVLERISLLIKDKKNHTIVKFTPVEINGTGVAKKVQTCVSSNYIENSEVVFTFHNKTFTKIADRHITSFSTEVKEKSCTLTSLVRNS